MSAPATEPAWLARAVADIDTANSRDPHSETSGGGPHPRELLYADRLTAWVLRLVPNASIPLRLAARCQHICRWEIPRETYPATKAGYLKWRADLKQFHARKAGEILTAAGCPADIVKKVQDLNLKKNFPADADCQTLEDALCLVFLEFQLEPLAEKSDDAKMINALKKSWAKMSPQARALAGSIPFSARAQRLLEAALNPGAA